VGGEAKKLITDTELVTTLDGRAPPYEPRMHIPHELLYAMEPTMPISQLHEMGITLFRWLYWANKTLGSAIPIALERMEAGYVTSDLFLRIAKKFWGSELAADFSTYDGKALAAKKIQDRTYAKESLILCDWLWPILLTASADYVGDPTVESKILSAVTGKEVDEEGLYLIGERNFNLQRAILIREGRRGRESDTIHEVYFTLPMRTDAYNPECLAPGKDGEIISKKDAVVDKEKFEKMKSEYYQLRGWDVATGLQTESKLRELGLEDIAKDLDQRGLIA